MAEKPHVLLVNYLVEEYLRQHGENDPQLPDMRPFLEWARSYMDNNRPSMMKYHGPDLVIQLTNGDEVMLAPPFKTGSMQPSMPVPVTGKDTAMEIMRERRRTS